MSALTDDLDRTAYWLIEIREALENLSALALPELDGDQIAAYRGAIARLDAAIFHGFHIIHQQQIDAWRRQRPQSSVSAPHKPAASFTVDDL